jgi:hypothetical protein
VINAPGESKLKTDSKKERNAVKLKNK